MAKKQKQTKDKAVVSIDGAEYSVDVMDDNERNH